MEFEKDVVDKARAICRHVKPVQVVQGKYPEEVCLLNYVDPGQPVAGQILHVRCEIKLGFSDAVGGDTCVLENPKALCRTGGEFEKQMRNLGIWTG